MVVPSTKTIHCDAGFLGLAAETTKNFGKNSVKTKLYRSLTSVGTGINWCTKYIHTQDGGAKHKNHTLRRRVFGVGGGNNQELRKKLSKDETIQIINVRGYGYKLVY